MSIKTNISLVIALLLVCTLVFQLFSILTIKSMANRKGDTVLEQIQAVCPTRTNMSYFRCSLVYLLNFGKLEFTRVDEVQITLPSDSVRGQQHPKSFKKIFSYKFFLFFQDHIRELDNDINTPAYALFYTIWILVVLCICMALSEYIITRNRNVINISTAALLIIAGRFSNQQKLDLVRQTNI